MLPAETRAPSHPPNPPNYVARLTKWFRDGTRANGIAGGKGPRDESDVAELHNRRQGAPVVVRSLGLGRVLFAFTSAFSRVLT